MIRLLIFSFFTMVLTSCNTSVNEGINKEQSSEVVIEQEKGCQGADCSFCDLPWGEQLASGNSIKSVYSTEIVKCGETCAPNEVELSCKKGVLEIKNLTSGDRISNNTPLYNKCFVQRCNCDHLGEIIDDGAIKPLFKQATASCNQTCESRDFRCDSGTMVDVLTPTDTNSYSLHQSTSCNQVACSECTAPWGEKIPHLGKVRAYKDQTLACGSNCNGSYRNLTCNNGSLTGANLTVYKYKSCTVDKCLDCDLGSGDTIAHNKYAWSYPKQVSACNESCYSDRKYLRCQNGVLSGGDGDIYKYTSCSPSTNCAKCRICGSNVVSGGTRTCFRDNKPSVCGLSCSTEQHVFSCTNGVIKKEDDSVADTAFLDTYDKSSCNELTACSSCELSDGRKVLDGNKVTFFKSSRLNCGEQCFGTNNAVTLTCSNGDFANKALYTDFRHLNCTADCTGTEGDAGIGRIVGDGGGAPRQLCRLPWGTAWVTHKTRVPAFSKLRVSGTEKCEDFKKVIECDGYRGLWTGGGTYIYASCVEP